MVLNNFTKVSYIIHIYKNVLPVSIHKVYNKTPPILRTYKGVKS